MRIFRCSVAPWLYPFSLAIMIILVLATTSHAAPQKSLWQSNDQFVALEQQDSFSAGPAQPNDHPVTLTLDRLAAILASLEISAAAGEKAEPLFTKSSVQTIAPLLLQGLQQASPAEDVTFAVIGLHSALYGLAKSPKVTTGRIFYQAGQLNIIVGLARQEVRDREDRRLFPFTPGSRKKALKGEWQLLLQADCKGCRLERKDWIIFSNDWREPVTTQNLPPAQAATIQPEKRDNRDNGKRTPAERLTTLKELREKGLISEEEYQGKRMEILNGL